MQTGGSIVRFKREFEQCASSAPPSTACDGSGAQAKLEPAALEPAQSEQAKSEQAQSEPPRKKRRRRGIRDRRLCLNDDMMAVVLPYVSRTSVKHLLLLSMVDRNLRDLVGGAHDMWRDIFRRWERLYYSRFSHSIAEEFATRCLQAMPVWMAPHGQSRVDFANRGVRVWNLQRVLPPLPHGSDWRDNGVPADRRVVFDRFVRKAMALVHIGCCGLCGTRQRSQRPVWSLGIRVCQPCWEGNVISNRALLQRYGIDVLKPLGPDRLPMYKECKRQVFYVYNNMTPKSRERFTMDPCDYPPDETRQSVPLWLFWKPHLSALVNLDARHAEYRARQEAATALAAHFKRAFSALINKSFAGKQRASQSKRVTALQRNEIRRRPGPGHFVDPCEKYHNSAQRQEMMNHADRMPEPFAGLPVPPVVVMD